MSFEEEFPSIVKAERVINCDYPSDDFVYCNELSNFVIDKQRVREAIDEVDSNCMDCTDLVKLKKRLGL